MNDNWIETKLRTIGKASFVYHLYPELKKNVEVSIEELASVYVGFQKYKLSSQKTKLSAARSIFKKGKVKDALLNISESNNIEREVVE